MVSHIAIKMFGAFTACKEDGKPILPKGAKTRALIALIATSDEFSRRRDWVQGLLWSDRGPEQQAASLRQSLVELRKCWADCPDVIMADRQNIWFDPQCVRIDRSGQARGELFLEDLKVRDTAFTAWVGLQRLRHSRPVAKPIKTEWTPVTEQRTIILIRESDTSPNAIAIERLAEDHLYAMISENAGVTVGSATTDLEGGDIVICSVKALLPDAQRPRLHVTLKTSPSGVVLFSEGVTLPIDPNSTIETPEFFRLLGRTSTAVRSHIGVLKGTSSIAGNVAEAVALMFTFQPQLVAEALTLLDRAQAIRTTGETSAWMAQALNIQFVERHVIADTAFYERVEMCCRTALALAPVNSDVLAAVSNARVNFDRDYAAGIELARRAVKVNPANPLAWWALSNGQLCVGRLPEALAAAERSRFFAKGTRFEFWADFQVCVTQAVQGSTAEAEALGERSLAIAPTFRPPLRYLVALNALRCDMSAARLKVKRLIIEEPDFSLQRMIEDDAYPIGIMRRYGRDLTDGLRLLAREL
jgi:tetratricopeptide (TPR) repeat protein